MKRIITLIGVVVILLTMAISVSAGSIPEDLLSEAGAKVFIGTVEDFTVKEIEGSAQFSIESVDVIPKEKIKGEVEVGIKETYERCDSILDLQKGKEYLFGYIDENNFYIYEIKLRNENTIKLVNSDKYDMTKRLEDYLNEGAFAMAEKERATIGKEIGFLEYLYQNPSYSSSGIEKVELRYQDELVEVNKDEFFEVAKDIKIIGAKNAMLYETRSDSKTPAPYETVLYIELQDANGEVIYYGAISRFGEVDRYSLFMSRLMEKDCEMNIEDLMKLYSFFPDSARKNMKTPEALPDSAYSEVLELPEAQQKDYAPIVWGTAVIVFIIAFALAYAIKKKTKK